MKHLVIIAFLTVILSRCESLTIHQFDQPKKDWADLEQWDKNSNESLDLGEFVEGYDEAGFFKKWQEKLKPISDSSFLFRTFGFLDRDHDNVLDSAEYNSRRILWTFQGMLKLKKWDKNCDKLLGLDEFLENAKDENLVLGFDLTADGQITEVEMAQGMFKVCDKNEDEKVGGMEFYLWEVYRR